MMKWFADLGMLGLLSVAWTWPLAKHLASRIPGLPGDNFSFVWNLWWMRRVLGASDLDFFHSTYLLSPFGVDLVNHPHTALQGLLAATVLKAFSVVTAMNLLVVASVFLNAVAAYALAYDITRQRRLALLSGVVFGTCPYFAAHLLGHYDLLSGWMIPLFALCFRRSLLRGSLAAAAAAGVCVALAAYAAYYHVVYVALFAVGYMLAWWECFQMTFERRQLSLAAKIVGYVALATLLLDLCLVLWINATGGLTLHVVGLEVALHTLYNPLLVAWVLLAIWGLTRWRIRFRVKPPSFETLRRSAQTIAMILLVFAIVSLPLIVQAGRLAASGKYVSQAYQWRSAPRGIDALALVGGNPFHPVLGRGGLWSCGATFDCIEHVGWLGLAPILVLITGRGRWLDSDEAKRWKIVFALFYVWALGPFLSIGGIELGLPLPQALARFVPLVENARIPGRAIVGAYMALGVLLALRLAAPDQSRRQRAGFQWGIIALVGFEYFSAPVPLTQLERPAVYERLASIAGAGPVIEVPFGIGDGLSTGVGAQDRRVLYFATIHGHPLVGGFIGRMPPGVAAGYSAMPVVGNLLNLSSGKPRGDESRAGMLPFRYLVLDTLTASPDLTSYVKKTLNLELILATEDRELYEVRSLKVPEVGAAAPRKP